MSTERALNVGYELRVVRPITTTGCFNFFHKFSNVTLEFLNDTTLGGNVKFNLFHDAFMKCFRECFPETQRRARCVDGGIEWFNASLKKQRDQYQMVCQLYNLHRTDALLSLKRELRCNYCKAISAAKCEATSRFITNS